MKGYLSGAHSRNKLQAHLVVVAKYRKAVFSGDVASCLVLALQSIARENGWGLNEVFVQQDHVHMLIQYPPDVSVSAMVQRIKGCSSRILREKHPGLKEISRGAMWSPGYFVESVGRHHEDFLRKYIRRQS